jgi:ABC-type amino acid transport substrate-binding protein
LIRRAIIVLSCVSSAAALLAGAPAFAADLQEIQRTGILRVLAGQGEQPEMFSFQSAEPPGFERELVEGFARLHKVKIQIHAVKRWEDRIPQLQKNEGDLVIGLVETPARREQIAFTSEVMPARHVVVSHKPRPAISTLEQFRGEKVGVVRATSWAQAAFEAGISAGKTEAFATTDEMLEALKAQRITASVMSLSDLTLAMRRYPGLQAGVALGEPASAGWGLRKEDRALQAALNEYLSNARKGASWSRLVVKYFGAQALQALGK